MWLRRDGSAPAVIYGYGSYETSMDPWFSIPRLSLLDRGVVMDDITAEIRGLVTTLVADAAGHLTPDTFTAHVASTASYHVDHIDYSVEFVDEGLRIVRQNVEVHASSEQVLWLRAVTVIDSSGGGG